MIFIYLFIVKVVECNFLISQVIWLLIDIVHEKLTFYAKSIFIIL